MSWILDNIQIIIAVAGAIAYWLNQRKREKEGQDADYDGDGIPERRAVTRQLDPKAPDPAMEEKARQVQEEIRRKIAERRAGSRPRAESESPPRPAPARPVATPPPVPKREPAGPYESPRPAAGGDLPDILRRVFEQAQTAPRSAAEEQQRRARAEAERAEQEAALARQRALQDELRALEERRRAEAQRAAAVRAGTLEEGRAFASGTSSRPLTDIPVDLSADLRDPARLRRAVLMREVLGAPAGLR